MKSNHIKLQCVGCQGKRNVTLDQARSFGAMGPACPQCGMPEYAISAKVRARRSNQDLRDVFKSR